MTQQIDPSRFKRATVNLKKLAIFLALIGLILLYLGWIRYPLEEEPGIQEMVWVFRIVSVVILYASLKCFLIERHLRTSAKGDAAKLDKA